MDAARLLYDAGNYRVANNRAYYAIFHAMRAVLVFDNFDSSKHSGVIAEFRRRYIKEGIFPSEISKMIGSAFTIRNASDYDDMFIASKHDTEEQIKMLNMCIMFWQNILIVKLPKSRLIRPSGEIRRVF